MTLAVVRQCSPYVLELGRVEFFELNAMRFCSDFRSRRSTGKPRCRDIGVAWT